MAEGGAVLKWTPGGRKGGGEAPPPEPPDGDGADGGDDDAWCAWQPQNDLGNARRLIRRHGAGLVDVEGQGWHGWDGRRWNGREGALMAQIAAQRTAEAIRGEAKAAERESDAPRAAALRTWAKKSGSSGAIAAMQREAAPHLHRLADDMDARTHLLTVRNGTLELGPEVSLRPHRREDLVTHLVDVDYAPGAACPRFLAFLAKIQPEPEIRQFLQRAFGYCLTGETREQVALLFHGGGSNGKSTLLNCVSHVIGDLHATLPIESVLAKQQQSGGANATPDFARLPGRRLVTTSEPEPGARLSESKLKQMTGGERMVVRKLREDFFEFLPQFKLVISFNNKPTVRGQDHGMWRRLRVVEFGALVGRDDVAPVLAALPAEAPGILAWMVEGAAWWYRDGLAPPAAVLEATEDYRNENDPVGRFLAEWCHRGADADGASIAAAKLWRAWCAWCAAAAEDSGSQTLFGKRLGERGVEREKHGTVFYRDLRLTADAEGRLQQGRGGPPAGDDGDPGA